MQLETREGAGEKRHAGAKKRGILCRFNMVMLWYQILAGRAAVELA
jgi:hypothetical protein